MSGRWRWLLGATCGVALACAGARAAAPQHGGGKAPADEAARLRPRITPEMERYSRTRYTLYFVGALFDAFVLFGLYRSGLSARLRTLAERRSRRRFGQALVYYVLFSALYTFVSLPLTFYSGWLLEQRYRLSTQSLGQWAWDGIKSYLVGLVLLPPVLVLLYYCLARSPRRWWLGFWLASIPLSLLLILIAPIWIDPLFQRFEPLRDAALREKILALAREAGIEGSRVFQVDMSKKTRKMNAYVHGFGATHRIVLWDTMLAGMEEDEILSVMAHEMGHYVLHHIYYGLALSIGGTFFLLLVVDRAARAALARSGERSGVRGLDDLATLPVLLLIVNVLNFLGAPVTNSVSRAMERAADDFELQTTHDGEAAARSFVKLAEQNLSHPDPPPFIEFWLFSHPPLSERIEHALAFPAESVRPLE